MFGLFQSVDRAICGWLSVAGACFARETRSTLRVGHERQGQDFDRDVAAQLRVTGAIDLADPARTEMAEDLERADPAASG